MRQRGFETISSYEKRMISLPARKTQYSAGYDIEAADTAVIPPRQVRLIKTGLKAYMKHDEYLGLHIRSGLAVKKTLMLANGQGIIDCDYYNNPDNEGHIMIAMLNYGDEAITIAEGERIAQAVFYKYYTTDDDSAETVRNGGFGSTGI